MEVNIIFFGQLAEICGTSNQSMRDVEDTDALVRAVTARYPALATARFVVAMDKEIIHGNTPLKEHSTIAFMPPFSGG